MTHITAKNSLTRTCKNGDLQLHSFEKKSEIRQKRFYSIVIKRFFVNFILEIATFHLLRGNEKFSRESQKNLMD